MDYKHSSVSCFHLLVYYLPSQKYAVTFTFIYLPTYFLDLYISHLLVGLVYFSEYLNTWGAKNWKSFASFNYFDKNGTFTSFVFSFPVIINSVIILVHEVEEKH